MTRPFPLPVVAFDGPGSQPEDDGLDYPQLPQGMATFRAPPLPEPEQALGCVQAHRALRHTLDALAEVVREGGSRSIALDALPAADRALLNQVLGEGEVSAVVRAQGTAGLTLQVQESVFAGVWRVIAASADGQVLADAIEVGAVPQALRAAAAADADPSMPRWAGALPPQVQNAPALLAEIEDHWRGWQPGQPTQVVNLTLLPMTPEDIGFLDHHLGTGRVLILSRGYGNCRITNALAPHVWRVVYYNSQDTVILNTVEVGDLPEVAQAAPEDLVDSHARLAEVLAWVEGA